MADDLPCWMRTPAFWDVPLAQGHDARVRKPRTGVPALGWDAMTSASAQAFHAGNTIRRFALEVIGNAHGRLSTGLEIDSRSNPARKLSNGEIHLQRRSSQVRDDT